LNTKLADVNLSNNALYDYLGRCSPEKDTLYKEIALSMNALIGKFTYVQPFNLAMN